MGKATLLLAAVAMLAALALWIGSPGESRERPAAPLASTGETEVLAAPARLVTPVEAAAAHVQPAELPRVAVAAESERQAVPGPRYSGDLIEVVVLDDQGAPVPAAIVRFTYNGGSSGSGSGAGQADERGIFRRKLTAGNRLPHDFKATHPKLPEQFAPATAEGVEPGSCGLVLRLERHPSLRLRVTDERGVPIERFSYTASPEPSLSPGRPWAVRGEQSGKGPFPGGEVEIFVAGWGSWLEVRINAVPGFEELICGPYDRSNAGQILEVRPRGVPGVRGLVTADGLPAAGVTVSLTLGDRAPAQAAKPTSVGTTDEAGRFYLPLESSGTFHVRAMLRGYSSAELGPLVLSAGSGAAGLHLELRKAGGIAGRVTSCSGEPVAGLFVIARRDGAFFTQPSDGAGSYRFEGLAAGEWRVEARPQDLDWREGRLPPATVSQTCQVLEGETAQVDLRMPEVGSFLLEGRLRMDGSAGTEWLASIEETSFTRISGMDEEGRFQLQIYGPGRRTLKLENRRLTMRQPLEITSRRIVWDLDLASGRLEVLLPRAARKGPLAMAGRLEGSSMSFATSPVACGNLLDDGRHRFELVPAGLLTVTFTSFNGTTWERLLSVHPGAVTVVDLR